MPSLEFNQKIALLLKDPDPDFSLSDPPITWTTYKSSLQDCLNIFYIEQDQLLKDLQEHCCKQPLGNPFALIERYQQWQKAGEQLEEFLKTPLAESLENENLFYAQRNLQANQKTMRAAFSFLDLFCKAVGLQRDFHTLPPVLAHHLLKNLIYSLQQYAIFAEKNPPRGETILAALELAITRNALLKEQPLQRFFVFFFAAFSELGPEKINLFLDEMLKIAIKSPLTLERSFYEIMLGITESLLEKPATWTFAKAEKRIRHLQKMTDLEEKETYSSLPDLCHFSDKVLSIYAGQPKLYFRLKKHKLQLQENGLHDTALITHLLDFCELISPQDVTELMRPILNKWIRLTPVRAAKLITLLSWIQLALKRDASTINKAKMSLFVDCLFALLWDNPSLADELFNLSDSKFGHLADFLASKARFDELTLGDCHLLFASNKSDVLRNLETTLEKLLIEQSDLLRPLHYCLDVILKFQDAYFDKSCSLPLKSKLEKLSVPYLQVFEMAIEIAENNPLILQHFLSLAFALPYSQTLKKYLGAIKRLPTDLRAAAMETLNELISENPEFLPQLIFAVTYIHELRRLKQTDPFLYQKLLSLYDDRVRGDVVVKLIRDPLLCANMRRLLAAEEKQQQPLLLAFLKNPENVVCLEQPLLNALCNNARFAAQFSLAFANDYSLAQEEKIFALLNKLLTSHASQVFELFEMTAHFTKALSCFLKYILIAPHCFEQSEYSLYHLFSDFYQSYRHSHPHFIVSILNLIEDGQEDLAFRLLRHEADGEVRHFTSLLSLADQQEYLAVDSQLKKLVPVRAPSSSPSADEQPKPAQPIPPTGTRLEEKDSSGSSIDFEKILFPNFSASERRACLDQELTAELRLKVALNVARTLLTHDGKINHALLEKIIQKQFGGLLSGSPFFKEYLERVCSIFQTHPEFSDLLAKQEAPLPFSRGELIVEHMLRLSSSEPITASHAREVALATLLCPLRQESVGSCFATSVIIHAASYPQGLLQILKDYQSFLTSSSLSRTDLLNPDTVRHFPLMVDVADFARRFQGDNLLLRAYEYTVASFSSVGVGELRKNLLESLDGIFFTQVNAVLDPKPLSGRDKIKLSQHVLSTLARVTAEFCLMTYSGQVQNPLTNTQGAWLLLDSENFKPLHQSPAVQLNFYTKVFQKAKSLLCKDFSEHEALFAEIFDQALSRFIQTPEFYKQLFTNHSPTHNARGLARLNRAKYAFFSHKTPFTEYSGGSGIQTFRQFHAKPTPAKQFPRGSNSLHILEHLTKKLPQDAKETGKSVSELLPVSTSDHSFNLELGKIKRLLAKGAQKIEQELRESASTLGKTLLSETLTRELIEAYLSYQDYPHPDIRALHRKLLLKPLMNYRCVNDLCEEIVRTDRELMGAHRPSLGRHLDWALRENASLKAKMPPLLPLADTNWEGNEHLSLSCQVHNRELGFVFTNSQNKHRRVSWWTPPSLSTWTFYRHPKESEDRPESRLLKPV